MVVEENLLLKHSSTAWNVTREHHLRGCVGYNLLFGWLVLVDRFLLDSWLLLNGCHILDGLLLLESWLILELVCVV